MTEASDIALKALGNQNDALRKLVIDCVQLASTAPIIQFDPEKAAAKGEVHVIQYLYQLEEWMKLFNRLQKKMNIIAPELLEELIDSGALGDHALAQSEEA